MKHEVKRKIEEKINAYGKKYGVKLNQEEIINAFLLEAESFNDSEMNLEHFETDYKRYYFRSLKTVYQNLIKKASVINAVQDEEFGHEEMLLPQFKPDEEILVEGTNAIKEFDLMFRAITEYTFEQCERDNRLKPDFKNLSLGGVSENWMRENLRDVVSGNNPLNAYDTLGRTDEERAQDGRDVLARLEGFRKEHDNIMEYRNVTEAAKHKYEKCGIALGETEKQAAAIYLSMRRDHRRHNFLWRWFKGGDSRRRLDEYKTEFCRIMGIKKSHATSYMKGIADGNAMTMEKVTSESFIKNLADNKILEGIKKENGNAMTYMNEEPENIVINDNELQPQAEDLKNPFESKEDVIVMNTNEKDFTDPEDDILTN